MRAFHPRFPITDELIYKPSPKVYQLAAQKPGWPIGGVRLISSNPLDVIGAMHAGIQAAWIDRSNGLFDTLGPCPQMVVMTLPELAERLG